MAQGVVIHQNKVLLVGNDYGREYGLVWSLPGGRLEPGEGYVQALVREMAEETGLTAITVGDLLYVSDALSPGENKHFTSCVFEVRLLPGVEPVLRGEVDGPVKDVRFVEFEQAAEMLISPSLGEPLLNYLYYGAERMPRRYWHYPDYLAALQPKLSWPPVPLEV